MGNIQTYIKQSQQLIYIAAICLLSFFVVAITALMPLKIFMAATEKVSGSLLSYVPLILGVSFLIGMIVCTFGLINFMGASQIKKILQEHQKTTSRRFFILIEKKIRKFQLLQFIALLLFVIAIILNISTALFLYLE